MENKQQEISTCLSPSPHFLLSPSSSSSLTLETADSDTLEEASDQSFLSASDNNTFQSQSNQSFSRKNLKDVYFQPSTKRKSTTSMNSLTGTSTDSKERKTRIPERDSRGSIISVKTQSTREKSAVQNTIVEDVTENETGCSAEVKSKPQNKVHPDDPFGNIEDSMLQRDIMEEMMKMIVRERVKAEKAKERESQALATLKEIQNAKHCVHCKKSLKDTPSQDAAELDDHLQSVLREERRLREEAESTSASLSQQLFDLSTFTLQLVQKVKELQQLTKNSEASKEDDFQEDLVRELENEDTEVSPNKESSTEEKNQQKQMEAEEMNAGKGKDEEGKKGFVIKESKIQSGLDSPNDRGCSRMRLAKRPQPHFRTLHFACGALLSVFSLFWYYFR